MNVGFRVYTQVNRPDPNLVERFADSAVPNIADAMHGITVVDAAIQPVCTPMKRILGPAVTVVLSPGDGLMLRKAVELCLPGDVIVVNAFGNTERAVLGGSVLIAAARKGVVGMILDGAIRDVEEIRGLDFPVMARGVTPRSGSTPSGWGEVNVPIACGGVVVRPGDIVIGDEEGIVVVPADYAADVLEAHDQVESVKGRPDQLSSRIEHQQQGPVHGMERTARAMADRGATIIEDVFK